MATHSNNLAWRIPWTEELGGLQSMGLQRKPIRQVHRAVGVQNRKKVSRKLGMCVGKYTT